uniref:Uncharacterized protein n=1 Tax=Anguilla anguilla TaxID=7936 RepID=A0A0E9WWU5_ANGAN
MFLLLQCSVTHKNHKLEFLCFHQMEHFYVNQPRDVELVSHPVIVQNVVFPRVSLLTGCIYVMHLCHICQQ